MGMASVFARSMFLVLGIAVCFLGVIRPVVADDYETTDLLAIKGMLGRELPALGHRNWIVIADSAYPRQSRAGIETVLTGAEQVAVVKAVMDALARSKHVRPVVYLDAEMAAVPEADAPGIDRYREQLKRVLGDRPVSTLPHEQIIDKLDKAAEKFNVVIIKTKLTVPYTSVFVQLDCGYWSAESEKRMRDKLEKK